MEYFSSILRLFGLLYISAQRIENAYQQVQYRLPMHLINQ